MLFNTLLLKKQLTAQLRLCGTDLLTATQTLPTTVSPFNHHQALWFLFTNVEAVEDHKNVLYL
jgi:hypothetical protein